MGVNCQRDETKVQKNSFCESLDILILSKERQFGEGEQFPFFKQNRAKSSARVAEIRGYLFRKKNFSIFSNFMNA